MKPAISDFCFVVSGYGHYNVTYTSPVTGKKWSNVTCNMHLIDATRNAESPKRCDLLRLMKLCKG